jgi:hypothetical protein
MLSYGTVCDINALEFLPSDLALSWLRRAAPASNITRTDTLVVPKMTRIPRMPCVYAPTCCGPSSKFSGDKLSEKKQHGVRENYRHVKFPFKLSKSPQEGYCNDDLSRLATRPTFNEIAYRYRYILAMEQFRIRPLSEADISAVIEAAGGGRAHADADQRCNPGADYLFDEAVIELKALDDEGLAKPERQAKLATLFHQHEQDRPVIVLDRARLPKDAQREYDRILEGPIKTAVRTARTQLKQSRTEFPSTSVSVLFVINNGYTALDHDALLQMVAHRVRNDTREIDGIVVAGCYFHSDTFDSFFLWPIDYVPINVHRQFASYEKLRDAWREYAGRFMTEVIQGRIAADVIKGPVVDTQFDIDGVTYVKPAPPIGGDSSFFIHGRPRKDSSGMERCPPVATTFPDMTREEWTRFRAAFPDEDLLLECYEQWQEDRAAAAASGTPLMPFVPIRVTFKGWQKWRREQRMSKTLFSVRTHANAVFEQKLRAIISSARERSASSIVPSRYVLVVTEEIGQDRANDLSHIAAIREIPDSEPASRALVTNARIFH